LPLFTWTDTSNPPTPAFCHFFADNVPGVDGIGIKGATALLQQFGTLETMLEKADEVYSPPPLLKGGGGGLPLPT